MKRVSLRWAFLIACLSLAAACGGGGGGGTNLPPTTYSVGGMVTGLTGTGLVLRNNGSDDLAIRSSGTFTFATNLASGASYSVTVVSHPTATAQYCMVSGGSGTVPAAPVTTVSVVCIGAGDLVITEVMPNPNVLLDASGEWIEIYNPTGADVDLRGCTLSDDGANSHVISASAVVAGGGGYIVLAASASPGFVPAYVYSQAEFALANSADQAILTCGGIVIDRITYTSTTVGASRELSTAHLNTVDNDTAANWCNGTNSYNGDLGTPGTANACSI